MWSSELDGTFGTTEGPLVNFLKNQMGKRGVSEQTQRKVADRIPGAVMGGAVGAGILGPVAGLPVGMAVGALMGNHAAKMRGAFKLGEAISEMPTRVMLGMHVYKETGSLLSMGDDVRHFLHDYSNLSHFEKKFLRRAMPFYNFYKMATRVIGTSIFENPDRVMAPTRICPGEWIRLLLR